MVNVTSVKIERSRPRSPLYVDRKTHLRCLHEDLDLTPKVGLKGHTFAAISVTCLLIHVVRITTEQGMLQDLVNQKHSYCERADIRLPRLIMLVGV